MLAANHLLERLVEELPVAVIVAEAPSGRMLLGNAAVNEVWRRPFVQAGDVAGYEAYEGFHADGRPYRPEDWPLARAVRGEVVRQEEIEIARGDGTRGRIEVSAVPILDADGTVTAAVVVFDDVTEIRRAEHSLELLADAGRTLHGRLDLPSALREVAELCVPGLADACGVFLAESDGTIARHLAIGDDRFGRILLSSVGTVRLTDDVPVTEVMRDGRPRYVADVGEAVLARLARSPADLEALRELRPMSTYVAPLTARGRTIGSLALFGLRAARTWEPREQALVAELARRCGATLDVAKLLADQRRTAETLQAGLLPPALPDVPGFEVAARYLPADERHAVGGDFYDLFSTEDDGWLVAVGDVCGKGIEAAALTALARHTIRAAEPYEADPAQLLAALNRALHRQDPGRAMLTAVVARIEADGEVRLARGGHPPPLLRDAAGEVRPVGPDGTMLGVTPDAAYASETTRMDPGDLLLVFTDGVTEARVAGGFVGEARLADALREATDAADAVARVERLVRSADARLRDDVALVALRRRP